MSRSVRLAPSGVVLSLVDDAPVGDGVDHARVRDGLGIDFENVGVQHDEIGELAHFNGADNIVHEVLVGDVLGVGLEQLVGCEPLFGPAGHVGVLFLGIGRVASAH